MDLSVHQKPISDVFTQACEASPITSEMVSKFERDGFLAGVPLLISEHVDLLRSELAGLMLPRYADDPRFYEYNSNESADPSRRLFHALGAWRVSEAFHDLIFSPQIVRCAESLLGGPVRFWHDQVFVKPPHDGAVVTWHQDYSYWTRTVPVNHLTCWIALDDSTEENGCVQYVPGSHRWQLLPREGLSGDMKAVYRHLNAEQMEAFQPVPSILKAGEASFHHPMMVHGSFENISDRPRRGVVINFIRDGVRSNTNEPLLTGVPVIASGQKLEGRFFPLLSGLDNA